MTKYPKRLIEVDLPIKRISAHARREKSIRHGHISTLHIWWARRPLAACRAVICASLWPDPADELCPEMFHKVAREQMTKWAKNYLKLLSQDSLSRFVAISKDEHKLDNLIELRAALLDFIADFANWDNSTVSEYLNTSRVLTQAAHEALGGEHGSHPLVVDPFAGGGSIPLEALRIGADAFASDLNPVAVLLNKVILEYIPKYGQKLANEVRKWGQWIKERAENELAEFYPKDPDGATPIAYLWARTIICEGPVCGAEVPLLSTLWLSKKERNLVALKIIPLQHNKQVRIEIIHNAIASKVREGTIRRGAATCPICGYTIPVRSVRRQLKQRKGGTSDARLIAVVTKRKNFAGKSYRPPTNKDIEAIKIAETKFIEKCQESRFGFMIIPNESTTEYNSFVNRGPIYGMTTWSDYFLPRQLIALSTLQSILIERGNRKLSDFDIAVYVCLALAIDRLIAQSSSLCWWQPKGEFCVGIFGRQAIPFVWDFCEIRPVNGASGDIESAIDWIARVCETEGAVRNEVGQITLASATQHPLPDDMAMAVITDPPYYYSVQYADLSDYFYVWLRRVLCKKFQAWFAHKQVQKDEEIIVQSPGQEFAKEGKNNEFYESRMQMAMAEGRRILAPIGIGVIVFAHKSTSGWEAQLEAMISAGWIITASWPIDTERAVRILASNRAVLGSSIHLVCRPRENSDGTLRTDDIGDWRDVLFELPKRIHDWMLRLAEEGVVGADAIFACLGPALEIFSRYSSVEKASGEKVELKEYLEEVWAAVSLEALTMIFEGADASGFEEDARLTAMWLWTLRTALNGNNGTDDDTATTKSLPGYSLEYDAARKIAQGLGAHLETLSHLVEIKGSTAVLLSAAARTHYLFGKDAAEAPKRKQKKKSHQLTLFDVEKDIKQIEEEAGGWVGEIKGKPGSTVLDQLHQCMILFGAGRGEAMKRFLVEEGVGRNPLFWRLAQALSALYPAITDEKRWVDGVLARKKGWGL